MSEYIACENSNNRVVVGEGQVVLISEGHMSRNGCTYVTMCGENKKTPNRGLCIGVFGVISVEDGEFPCD